MLCQVFHLDCFEDALTNVELHRSDLDPLLISRLEQLLGEVQARCRGCDRTNLVWVGKDALICFLVGIGRLALDVLRQRHLTNALDHFMQIAVVREPHRAATRCRVVNDFAVEAIIVEIDLVANTHLARRLYEYVPNALLRLEFAQQHHFNLRVGLLLLAEQTCRKYLGVVHNDHVALVHVVKNILELLVFDVSRFAVENHHFRGFAWICWILGNSVFRDGELELRELHGIARS